VQAPGLVALLSEMMHEARLIPLNGRPHISANIRQWMGDSRGHWEGNTLVVDTQNFPDRDVTGFGVPYRHSETLNLHLTEHITRIGADTLDYLYQAVDGLDSDGEEQRPSFRICLPRRELQPHEHTQRIPGRG
jgi:hypothetical protein